jgi:hypothetical protein
MRFRKYGKQNYNFYKIITAVHQEEECQNLIVTHNEMKYVITSFYSLIFDPNFTIFNIMCTFLPLNG